MAAVWSFTGGLQWSQITSYHEAASGDIASTEFPRKAQLSLLCCRKSLCRLVRFRRALCPAVLSGAPCRQPHGYMPMVRCAVCWFGRIDAREPACLMPGPCLGCCRDPACRSWLRRRRLVRPSCASCVHSRAMQSLYPLLYVAACPATI